jgi:phosphoglucomutase/phosphomannomutase
MSGTAPVDVSESLHKIAKAKDDGLLSATAVDNIRSWLTEGRYAEYRDQVIEHIDGQRWKQLDDAFWTIIPFGTGGRRGRMYPIGSNAINDRTIGESAQGLADYAVATLGTAAPLSCAIAYDTRHQSRHFAEWCAGIMVANGFKVYFLDEYRATPQLSFAVRMKHCTVGIMVTASHNPPSDNAVKVYWSNGAQVLPPHDEGIIQRVLDCQEIRHVPFAEALADGRVEIVTAEVDAAYSDAVAASSFPGPRELKILFTPLHGVGALATLPVLARDGFKDVELYGPHSEPSPDFPNVPGHVSNPENTAVFDQPIRYAQASGHQLILATDPDADRLGCAAPLTLDTAGPWATLTGNQLGVLLADYVLSRRRAIGDLTPEHYVVKTLVTTEMVRRVAESYGVRCEGELLVGFKNIAATMDKCGPDRFVFGTEESHGYLVGQYVRDKDGPVACMLMSELAAQLLSEGRTVHDRLAELYLQHGYHQETVINLVMEGSEGMASMTRLMASLRNDPVRSLAGMPVVAIRDYQNSTRRDLTSLTPRDDLALSPLDGPVGDLIIMDLAEPGNYVAARPSGTEPKIKLYVFARLAPAESADLAAAKSKVAQRLTDLEDDMRGFAETHS